AVLAGGGSEDALLLLLNVAGSGVRDEDREAHDALQAERVRCAVAGREAEGGRQDSPTCLSQFLGGPHSVEGKSSLAAHVGVRTVPAGDGCTDANNHSNIN